MKIRLLLTLAGLAISFAVPASMAQDAMKVVTADELVWKELVTLGLSPDQELQPDRGLTMNLETIHSDLDDIVTQGFNPGQELQADPGGALTPETVHSDPDEIVTRGLPPRLKVNLHRGKSLPDTDDTSAIVPRDRWDLGDDLTKMLLSINPGLGDNVDANAAWKLPWGIALIPLVPYFGALLLFVSGIVKSGLTGQRNRKREQRKPYDARPPALDKFTAAFLTIRERQQKAVDEKERVLPEHFSDGLDGEKARAEIEHAQETEETFRKDFNGTGLS